MTFLLQRSARGPALRFGALPIIAVLLLLVGLSRALYGAEADGTGTEDADACVEFMKLHGTYLDQGLTGLADQADDKARAAGCYDRKGDEKLCALLADQESQFSVSGRMDLVNIIRGQERSFQCIQ